MRAWFAACAVALAVSAVAASTATAFPAVFWGIDPQITPSADQYQRIAQGGVDSIRIPVAWSAVQPHSGSASDWSGVDGAVKGAAENGVDVLPFVYSAPLWAVAGAKSIAGAPPMTLPVKTGAQRSAWISFLAQAVGRYGPNGSFWAENPTVPKRPIRTWQIWNEENFKYFVAKPNPADYGKLVKISYTALKSVDPGAKIVLGGLFAKPKEARPIRKNPPAYFATEFLDRMYRANPGIKTKFSGIALHPYTGRYQDLTLDIEEVRTVLKENHDPGKGLWITELGWSSQKPVGLSNIFAKGITGQKQQLQGAFSLLKSKQKKWKIQRVYWFSLDDAKGSCNFCDGSGLFGPGFVPKPAWSAYVKFAGGVVG